MYEIFETHFGTHIGFGSCVEVFYPLRAALRAHMTRDLLAMYLEITQCHSKTIDLPCYVLGDHSVHSIIRVSLCYVPKDYLVYSMTKDCSAMYLETTRCII